MCMLGRGSVCWMRELLQMPSVGSRIVMETFHREQYRPGCISGKRCLATMIVKPPHQKPVEDGHRVCRGLERKSRTLVTSKPARTTPRANCKIPKTHKLKCVRFGSIRWGQVSSPLEVLENWFLRILIYLRMHSDIQDTLRHRLTNYRRDVWCQAPKGYQGALLQ